MERSENNPHKKAPGGKLISSISSPSRLLRMGGGGGARAMAGAVDAVYPSGWRHGGRVDAKRDKKNRTKWCHYGTFAHICKADAYEYRLAGPLHGRAGDSESKFDVFLCSFAERDRPNLAPRDWVSWVPRSVSREKWPFGTSREVDSVRLECGVCRPS